MQDSEQEGQRGDLLEHYERLIRIHSICKIWCVVPPWRALCLVLPVHYYCSSCQVTLRVWTTTELDHRMSHIMTRTWFRHWCWIRRGSSEEHSINESVSFKLTVFYDHAVLTLLPFHRVWSQSYIKNDVFSTSSTSMQWLNMRTDPFVHCQLLLYTLADTA